MPVMHRFRYAEFHQSRSEQPPKNERWTTKGSGSRAFVAKEAFLFRTGRKKFCSFGQFEAAGAGTKSGTVVTAAFATTVGMLAREVDRLFDLLPIVREHTYYPAFAGSCSIKSVLPALVPEMSYQGMQVSKGREVGLVWESLVRGGLNCDERERIEKALMPIVSRTRWRWLDCEVPCGTYR
jgi:hypothetical protein